MVAMPNINLPTIENFDAEKICRKKTIFGKSLLSSKEKQDVRGGHNDIDKANYDLKNVENDLHDCEDDAIEGETQTDETKTQNDDGEKQTDETNNEDKKTDEKQMTSDDLYASALEQQEIIDSMNEEYEDLNKDFEDDNETDFDEMTTSQEELDDLNNELENLNEQLENEEPNSNQESALAKPMSTPMDFGPESDGMGGVVDSAFDGTGSGTNSAYSLSTATETEEDNKAIASGEKAAPATPAASPAPVATPMAPASAPSTNPATGNTGNSAESDTTSAYKQIAKEISTKSERAAELGRNIETTGSSAADRNTEYSTNSEENVAVTEDITEQGEEAQDQYSTIREGLNVANKVCDLSLQTFDAVTKTGKASLVVAKWTDTTAKSTDTTANTVDGTATGMDVTAAGLAGGIVTAEAAPPVEGGAQVTHGSANTTRAVSKVVQGISKACESFGNTAVDIGEQGTAYTQVAKAGVEAAIVVDDLANERWMEALTGAISAAGNFAQGMSVADDNNKEFFDKIAKGAKAAETAVAFGKAVDEGKLEGMITSGVSLAGQGLSMTKNAGLQAWGDTVTGAVSTYNGAKSTVEAIKKGNVVGIISNGIGLAESATKTYNSFDKAIDRGDVVKDKDGNVVKDKNGKVQRENQHEGKHQITTDLASNLANKLLGEKATDTIMKGFDLVKDVGTVADAAITDVNLVKTIKNNPFKKENSVQSTSRQETTQHNTKEETSTEDTGFTEAELAALSAKYGRRR